MGMLELVGKDHAEYSCDLVLFSTAILFLQFTSAFSEISYSTAVNIFVSFYHNVAFA
jgi:hypothetical protein